ncbi:Uncharacterised protein [Mycobacteroides abscessus subsp. abscessus]|nr:Uncharacterised protein [Mycobacteroides abscessus subsp. abscessus]
MSAVGDLTGSSERNTRYPGSRSHSSSLMAAASISPRSTAADSTSSISALRSSTNLVRNAFVKAGFRSISINNPRITGVLRRTSASALVPIRSRSSRREPVFGRTNCARIPSMKAASTSSAFDGQRR